MGFLQESSIGKSTINWLSLGDNQKSDDDVYSSWCNANFVFREEDNDRKIEGLRPPQIGGVFAALGFEKSDEKNAATIVMPTGTGKTETILSIVVAGKFRRTLVIVPSDALREQTKRKFIELGLLRKLSLIDKDFENPIVATIKQSVDNASDLEKILKSNIVVATASVLSKFSSDILSNLISQCSHLIVDEAHHITASTWQMIKARFADKRVFQFTATPFRTDRSRVEGKIIFNYPLKKAQQDGYFKPIEFHPVREFVEENADKAIADKAIALLREDLGQGLDHIIMARAYPTSRAEKIYKLYEKEADLNPVFIHSKVNNKLAIIEAIKKREHRIIVCVDMLGEGFDLPQLKISAIHDPHKSINIMLQFTGRFTRTAHNVGDAKFIANIANPAVNDSLEDLYKEDSDWNSIISDISSSKIKDEREYQDFRAEFSNPSKLLDLGLTPSISTTLYIMGQAIWTPSNFQGFGTKNFQIIDSILNDEENTLIFSVKSYLPVGWTSSKELYDESWDLYIAYYDKSSNLLFIHSSAKDGLVKRLVKLVAKDAIHVRGEYVFRSFAGLKRLKLQNVGLNKNRKGLRYSMHTGTEINEQIPDIEANRATKSNIFGKGYENGELVSVGCSHKGKIWAMDSDSLDKWISWCKGVGRKILDDTIDTNEIMKTAMQTEELEEFPSIRPLNVEWPVELLRKNESKITISSGNWEESLVNCELSISETQNDDQKAINIDLVTKNRKSLITAQIPRKGEMVFSSQDHLSIKIGEQEEPIAEFFDENPPTIFLADTSVIDGGLRFYLHEGYVYFYDKNNIESWDWSTVDISIESQTEHKLTNSIQYYTIQKILNDYDVVFDDDDAGEVADIVAIKNIDDKELIIDLFHCKYCAKVDGVAKPGARIDDVYQVAGQAVKSVKWFGDKAKLIYRLMERERSRLSKGQASRIDKGSFDDLLHLSKVSRYASFQVGVTIVQPAISKDKISKEQLSILGATEAYIDEVCGVKLRVVVNQ